MSSATQNRTRSERVASLQLPPGKFQRFIALVRQSQVWVRFAIALIAALIILTVCQCWRVPFAYRTGYIPPRDMYARVQFDVPDLAKTQSAKDLKRRSVIAFYSNRSLPLTQLREKLKDQMFLVLEAPSFDQLSNSARDAWAQFFKGDETAGPDETAPATFAALKATFAEDEELQKLDKAIRLAMFPFYETGLLRSLEHEEGDASSIRVYPENQPSDIQLVPVDRVRIAQASLDLKQRIIEEFKLQFEFEKSPRAAKIVGDWLADRLPVTLDYDEARSEEARKKAADEVPDVLTTYYPGRTSIAPSGKPLGKQQLDLLQSEWNALQGSRSFTDAMMRLLAYAGMLAALYLLCGSYIYFVHDPVLITDVGKLTRLLSLVVLVVSACWYASADKWQAEVIPLVLAAITATVAYGRELALLLIAASSLAVTLLIGQDLPDLVVLSAATLSCILLLGRIRTRTRLITIGAGAALVTAATVIGVGVVAGQSLGSGEPTNVTEGIYQSLGLGALMIELSKGSVWAGTLVLVASMLMTGLLPFVEKIFGVQTDLSLLELGDASHPLLRQLAQRAPGTYNHSINVASIAEAAADAIGGNGLLVRVGAYFHDIGKIFKPDYFIENQGGGPNQHDSLQPAMSTLVIIAHVKDGADLARSHHLPEPMIDFILQHHGTTLVEYFYREAKERSEESPNKEEVSDKDFRYPGPKPRSLEAAVLMLSDGVESASRTLVDPTPARIKSLVEQIAMKRLTDGQFDESGLTLKQLDRVKQSLVKSLTAIYHARVKYPGQQTA
ncbi:Ribonuclease Y [Rosistilla carotiformis]|uniref:Ribonuclease Y n=1 Tax=Rosistilla carotiformis TaxID=2528017 RepID=A0A518JUE9_9BACT|nr:HDIG domain-containing metalloprotein [Rosistilla carotiformis]QDV69171.1 Ribonuclease Y [Rosistilla carotiformis]